MRVLVTGSTGLLGRGVVAALAAHGAYVVALVRPGSTPAAQSKPLVHDLSHSFPPAFLPDVECVVHLAHHPHVAFPEHATALHRLNTGSTQELLEAARLRGVGRFVYASSGGVYGWSQQPLTEDDPPRADDFYSLTKLHAEALIRTYQPFFPSTIIRPFFPYGPHQGPRLIPRLASAIRRGEPVKLRPDAGPRINPVYVDDAVDAIVRAVRGLAPTILNLAGPDVVSIRDLAVAIGEVVGRQPTFERLDGRLEGDLVGSTERLCALLGRPLLSLESGLELAIGST